MEADGLCVCVCGSWTQLCCVCLPIFSVDAVVELGVVGASGIFWWLEAEMLVWLRRGGTGGIAVLGMLSRLGVCFGGVSSL